MSYRDEEDYATAAERALAEKRENQLVERVASKVSGQLAGTTEKAVSGLKDDILDVLNGRQKAIPAVDNAARCKVTAPGYTEQFSDSKEARKAYAKQVAKLNKKQEAGTVRLFAENPSNSTARSVKWDLVQELKLDEDAFE